MRGKPYLHAAALMLAAAFVARMPAASEQLPAEVDALAGFTPDTRADIQAGTAVVEVLHAHHGDFAVAGAVPTSAAPERLVAWAREIEALQRGRYVPLIQRFSNPPRIEDLAALTLDDQDLEDLRECRPGRCDVKLSASEIRQVHGAIEADRLRWREAVADAFRSIMLARVRAFEAGGFRNLPPYDDEEQPVHPSVEFDILLGRFAQDALFSRRVANYLRAYPRGVGSTEESFFYWSKDLLGDAKPIISITHLAILHGTHGEPTTVVAWQVFASHYLNASLSLTAVTGCRGDDRRYLVYLRRSRADVFDGMFGGLVRRVVRKRVRAEGPPMLEAMRLKLERSVPPLDAGPVSR